MSEMLLVEQRQARNGEDGNGAPFILDRHGRKMQGRDDERRTAQLREGLTRHEDVRPHRSDVPTEHIERVLARCTSHATWKRSRAGGLARSRG